MPKMFISGVIKVGGGAEEARAAAGALEERRLREVRSCSDEGDELYKILRSFGELAPGRRKRAVVTSPLATSPPGPLATPPPAEASR